MFRRIYPPLHPWRSWSPSQQPQEVECQWIRVRWRNLPTTPWSVCHPSPSAAISLSSSLQERGFWKGRLETLSRVCFHLNSVSHGLPPPTHTFKQTHIPLETIAFSTLGKVVGRDPWTKFQISISPHRSVSKMVTIIPGLLLNWNHPPS